MYILFYHADFIFRASLRNIFSVMTTNVTNIFYFYFYLLMVIINDPLIWLAGVSYILVGTFSIPEYYVL